MLEGALLLYGTKERDKRDRKSFIGKGREGKRKKGKNPFYISFINILELRGFGFGFGDGKFI